MNRLFSTKKNISKRTLFFLAFTSLVLFIFSFAYLIFLKDYKVDGGSYYNRQDMGNGNITSIIQKEFWYKSDNDRELLVKSPVKGSFIARTDNLGIISIPFDIQNGAADDRITFRLKKIGENGWYYQNEYKANLFQNNIPFPFGFPIIKQSKNTSYAFEIESSEGKSGKSFSLSKINPYFFTKYKFSKTELTRSLSSLSQFIFLKIDTRLQFLTVREIILVFILSLSPFIYYLYKYIFRKMLISRKKILIFHSLNKKKSLFYIITISAILIFLLCGLITRAHNNYNFFFLPTQYDYYSDFYYPLAESFDGPYAHGNIYPPLPSLVYRYMLRLIPYDIASHGHSAITASHAGQMLLLFYMLTTLFLLFVLLMEIKKGSRIEKYALGFVILFSSPFLFTFERGNIIFLALLSLIVYVFFKDNKNRFIREVALVFLAVSAAIKIYPAIFGLLLIKEKRFKDILRVLVYVVALVVLPVFALGGLGQLMVLFKNIFSAPGSVFDRGVGYAVNVQDMARTVGALFGNFGDIPIFIGKIFSFVILILGVTSAFFLRSKWKTVAMLSLLMVLIPSLSFEYVLIFMMIPLVMFLDKEEEDKQGDYLYLLCFIVIFIPLALGKIDFINGGFGSHARPLTYGLLLQNIALLIMTGYLVREGLMEKGLEPVRKFLQAFMLKLSNLISKFDKFYWAIPVFVIFTYNLILFNKYLPITEGWFSTYAGLINRGQLIYRDFYFFLTPFYPILISIFTHIFGYSFVYLRIFGIGVILLMTYFLYKIFEIIFGRSIAGFVSIVGIIYYQSGVAHITYDFTQFLTLFGLIQSYLLLKYVNSFGSKTNTHKNWVFWAGIFASLIFLTKQSNGAIITIFSFAGLLFLSLQAGKKELLRSLLFYVCGFILPIIITGTWLLANSAFSQFWQQVFLDAVSAKGGLAQIFLGWFKEILTYNFVARFKEIIFILLISGYGLYIFKDQKLKNENLNKVLMIIASFALLTVIFLPFFTGKIPFNQLEGFVQEGISRVMVVSVLAPIILVIIYIFIIFLRKPYDKSIFLLSFIAIGFLYGAGTSAGFSEAGAFIGFCLFIALMLRFRSAFGLGKIFIILFCIIFSFFLVEFKYVRPYYWWNVTSPDIRSELRSTDKINILSGMYTSADNIKLIEEVTKEIRLGSKPGEPVLTYPNIPIFYLLSDRKPPGKAIVYWFDFMPDTIALKEAEAIKKNPPKVIVYLDFPPLVWEIHEHLFRDSKPSGQRKIVETFMEIVKSEKMHISKRYELPNGVNLTVWRN